MSALGHGWQAVLGRHRLRSTLAALDPVADHQRIALDLATREFPWDVTRALEFALFRTYAVPGIGRLLDRTGELTRRTQQRYDDTALLLGEALEGGLDAPRGRAAVRRINQLHGRFDIPDHEMRYVLATFVVCPVRWLARYGWRPLTRRESDAWTNYYRRLGALMGIRDVPETYDEFAALLDGYEREHFRPDPASRRVADRTAALFVGWYPRPLAPVARRAVVAMMDDPLREAFGYPPAPRWVRRAVEAGLRGRARVLRWLPPRRTPRWTADNPFIRSYPAGYDVDRLGPPADQLPRPTRAS